jgi:rod shape-determining protein MreB and related proteins
VPFFKNLFWHGIGVDLGTANTLIYIHDKGVVLREPSVVAVDENTNMVRWVGEEARAMIGRTPQGIRAIRPLKDGVIADLDYAKIMLRKFVERATGAGGLKNPDIAIGVPSGVTPVEKIAIKSAAESAHATSIYLPVSPSLKQPVR